LSFRAKARVVSDAFGHHPRFRRDGRSHGAWGRKPGPPARDHQLASDSSYFLGAEHDFGQVTAGAIPGNSELIGDARTVQAHAVYSPTARLELTGNLLHAEVSGTNFDVYGVDANFDLTDIAYVEVGYLGGDLLGSGADMYTVSLGINF